MIWIEAQAGKKYSTVALAFVGEQIMINTLPLQYIVPFMINALPLQYIIPWLWVNIVP